MSDTVLGACVLTVFGGDGSTELSYPGNDSKCQSVDACRSLAQQKANDDVGDDREFGAAPNTFHILTFSQDAGFRAIQVDPEE